MQIQVDTSDAAYERRHRKYETFEKRQRFREKEKLKHEQYKLKERVEQLRIMDSSAFLALPASDFSPAPSVQVDDVDAGIADMNGATAHNEGERRRKEMLDIAFALEARFRVLLPPDRVRKSQSRPAMREDNTITPTTPIFRHSSSEAEMSGKEEEVIYADSRNLRQDLIKAKSAEKDSKAESPASASVSRASERSGVTSLSLMQKPERRQSCIVLSCSPPPVISPHLTKEPVIPPEASTDPSPERTALPYIGIEGLPEQEEQLGPESEEEVNLPFLSHEQLISAPDKTMAQIQSSAPPQKHSPLLDVQPLIAPELNPIPVEQEAFEDSSEPSQPVPLPGVDEHESSFMYIDVEHLPEPPTPPHFPLPPPIATLSDAFPLQSEKTAPRRRRGRPPKRPEQKSGLLELAEVAQSISMGPSTKRAKTSYYNHPSEKLPVHSYPSLQTARPNQESMAEASSERQLHSPLPEQPSETRDGMALFAPSYSFIAASGSRRSSARRGITIAEYQSDTGELRWTTTPLLVAAIRGGQRQTQRHQIAFGVKVPDQIADPYDFWLPDEYLPQEELQRQQLNI